MSVSFALERKNLKDGKEDKIPQEENEGSHASDAEQRAKAIKNNEEKVLSGSSVQLNVDEIKKTWLKAALYLVPNA